MDAICYQGCMIGLLGLPVVAQTPADQFESVRQKLTKFSMDPKRSLDEQFEEGTVEKIREIQARLRRYPIRYSAGHLFAHEIDEALEAGLLLASVALASTLIEIFVRDKLINLHADEINVDDLFPGHATGIAEIEIEDLKKLSFKAIINQLVEYKVIDEATCSELSRFYERIRIPLLHGLTRRYLRGEKFNSQLSLTDPEIDEVFLSWASRFMLLDEHLEEDALNILEELVHLIEKC
jgi:hypothetical protein